MPIGPWLWKWVEPKNGDAHWERVRILHQDDERVWIERPWGKAGISRKELEETGRGGLKDSDLKPYHTDSSPERAAYLAEEAAREAERARRRTEYEHKRRAEDAIREREARRRAEESRKRWEEDSKRRYKEQEHKFRDWWKKVNEEFNDYESRQQQEQARERRRRQKEREYLEQQARGLPLLGWKWTDRFTRSQVKKRFRELAHKLHPDHGGSTEQMAQLNAEYESALNRAAPD